MKEIKTIRGFVITSGAFDLEVNKLLREGWRLMPGSPFSVQGDRGISELVAFLEREVPNEGI